MISAQPFALHTKPYPSFRSLFSFSRTFCPCTHLLSRLPPPPLSLSSFLHASRRPPPSPPALLSRREAFYTSITISSARRSLSFLPSFLLLARFPLPAAPAPASRRPLCPRESYSTGDAPEPADHPPFRETLRNFVKYLRQVFRTAPARGASSWMSKLRPFRRLPGPFAEDRPRTLELGEETKIAGGRGEFREIAGDRDFRAARACGR